MFLRFLLSVIVLFAAVSGLPVPVLGEAEMREVSIGFVMDGPWERNDQVLALKRQEISDILAGEFAVSFPPDRVMISDFTLTGIAASLDTLLNDPAIDLIIAAGPVTSHVAATRSGLSKPVIAPYIIDAELQGIPQTDGASGITNLSYLAPPWAIEKDIREYSEVIPFRKLAFLATGYFLEAIPTLISKARSMGQVMGVEIQIVRVYEDVQAALESLDSDVDAVYLTGLLQLSREQFDRLMRGINSRKLPSFSLLGRYHVERGVMAGLLPDDFFARVARRVALNTQRILLGEKPEDLPVAFVRGEKMTINMATVREIGKYPSWAVLTEAELINESRNEVERSLTLAEVMREAIQVNLDLTASRQSRDAAARDIGQAAALLLPQVELSALGLVIDKDRAEASFGSQAERTVTGTISGSQLLFSERAWSNLSIQRSLQRSREASHRTLELDVGQTAEVVYLNLLRAKTFERIQRDNLKVTRSNLDLARVRQTLGMARAAEVLRWESLIASNRSNVISANSQRNIAEIQLNTLLHRPAEEDFSTTEVTVEDPDLLGAGAGLYQHMSNPKSFRLLRTFMETEALNNSPEIKQLDAAIDAQERLVSSNTWRFFTPTVGLSGELSRLFSEDGAGSESTPALPGLSVSEADDVNWSVGLQLSLPLFEGGSRFSERYQSHEELEAIKLQRRSVADKIKQRIRSSMHAAGASYAIINLARDAARAADQSLELVIDAYSRGAVSILDLIDAQNAALVADLRAANAEYDFLIDLSEVERAGGQFFIFMSESERGALRDRLSQFFNEARDEESGR